MDEEILQVLKDLSFINAVIATELIRIAENTAIMAKGPQVVEKCAAEHQQISEKILELVESYKPNIIEILKKHVLKH
ncbi:MAG TPA: hypothetical protein VMV49_10740 [Candidatus Deferrimicrobium sp.]|nr:hypothetical protein [Candidatus Deferrimicrobium sp.]